MNFPKKLRFIYIALIAVALFFLPIFQCYPVFGQTYQAFRAEMESIKVGSGWTLGPFRIRPGLQFNLGYDDNIYGTYAERAPEEDYVSSLSLPLNIYLPFRDWLILSFSDTPRYEYFFNLDEERSFNNSYSTGFRLLVINRFVVSGGYGTTRMKYRAASEIDRRIFQEVRGYNGSIFLETLRGSSLGFSGSINEYDYEDVTLEGSDIPLSGALNREERNGRIEFFYRVFTDSSLFINVGYTDYKFANPEGDFRDSYSYQINSGIAFPLFGRARGALSLGYKKLIPRDKELKGFSGPVGDTGLEFRLGRFNVRAQYRRDIPFSYGENIFYLSNNYGAGMSFYLSSLIRLDYDFSYGGASYPELMSIILPDGTRQEVERNDIYRTHSAGIVFRIIKNTGLGLSAIYSERKSSYYLYSSDRFTVGVFLTYEF